MQKSENHGLPSFSSVPSAAVLLVLYSEGEPSVLSEADELLLTRRALGLRAHAGEVAFPGGKRDASDESLYDTATRECFEEVGIASWALSYLCELPNERTRSGAVVTPYVAQACGSDRKELDPSPNKPQLVLNRQEIDSAFWVPLSYFIEDKRARTHVFRRHGREFWAPVYEYDGYEIWGFTARVIVGFVNRFFDAGIQRLHKQAPEIEYR